LNVQIDDALSQMFQADQHFSSCQFLPVFS
jgi:hypothetical protein